MAYSLTLALKNDFFVWAWYNSVKKIDTLYHTDLMLNKMRSIYLALKQKVIKFLMAFTLYGQLFGSALTVLSPAKIIFIVHYKDFLVLAVLNLVLTLAIIMSIRSCFSSECYKITDSLRLEGITEDFLVQALAESRASLSRLLGTLSSNVLNISRSTASLGYLFQHLTTLTHFFSHIFKWNLWYFNLCPLPLDYSLDTTEMSLGLSSLAAPIRYLYTLVRPSPDPSPLQAKQSQQCQPFLM